MNTFYEHHENSIRFGYRCFDRVLINGPHNELANRPVWRARRRCALSLFERLPDEEKPWPCPSPER